MEYLNKRIDEVIKTKSRLPDKIYYGDVDIVKLLSKRNDLQKLEQVYNPVRYNKKITFRYEREMIDISTKEPVKRKTSTKKKLPVKSTKK